MKKTNAYSRLLGALYDRTPKAVFAGIVVSLLTCGGDDVENVKGDLLKEWDALYQNGIVPQKPPTWRNR